MKLYKNGSGRYAARLKTGNPAKPYVKITLGTKSAEEAKRKAKDANLAKIEAAHQAGSLTQQAIARLTVGKKLSTEQAFVQWLARGANRGESPATTEKNRSVGEQWFAFIPAVKSLPPMSLTEDHVAPFINRKSEDAGAATRARQLSVLRQFFGYCADLGISQGNPARLVDVDHRALGHEQREKKAILPFTAEEVRTIIDGTEGWWRWASAISAATALRLGDVCQLEHACLAVPGHIIVWTDKRDRRVCLPINSRVTPRLAAILAEIPPTDSPYLFPDEAKQYEDIKTGRPKFSVYFGRVLDQLGIDRAGGRKSFHSLRHHAITRWDAQGFSLDECKTYAGHSNAKTTSGYIHRA